MKNIPGENVEVSGLSLKEVLEEVFAFLNVERCDLEGLFNRLNWGGSGKWSVEFRDDGCVDVGRENSYKMRFGTELIWESFAGEPSREKLIPVLVGSVSGGIIVTSQWWKRGPGGF